MSQRCTAKTTTGDLCKNKAVEGSKRCKRHETRRTAHTRAQAREAAMTAERVAKKEAFIAELSKRGIVLHACNVASVGRATAYQWYDADPDFAAAWDRALEIATDAMEAEAWRRGVEGVEKPLIVGGRLVSERVFNGQPPGKDEADGPVAMIREYSDSLLQVMLKANRPEKYRDRASLEVTGKNGGPVKHEHLESIPTEDLIAEAEAILRATARDTGRTPEA
jgi:hypothetical protein